MKSRDIEKILFSFVNNSQDKAILIEGPWGCGKTFEILRFIKANKDLKIHYLSLFGLESVDEINTALYQVIHKKGVFFKKELHVLTKAIKAVPLVGDISEALEYQLNLLDKQKIKGKTIIILDDLERLSKKVQFSDLLGYINSLFLSECRFICLMSNQGFVDNQQRKKEFDDFKEKIYDRVFSIEETNIEILADLLEDFTKEEIEVVSPLFESNIRMALRTRTFYGELAEHYDEKDLSFNDTVFSSVDIFTGCIIATGICLKTFPEYKKEKDDRSYYDSYVKMYGREIANGYMYYKNKSDFLKINKNVDLVFALIDAYKGMDYSSLDYILKKPETIAPSTILDQEFYYLSDDNKKLFCNTFFNKIHTGDLEWNKSFVRSLSQIVIYSDMPFSDSDINRIAQCIVNSKEEEALFRLNLAWELIGISDANKENGQRFLDALSLKTNELISESIIQKLDKNYNNSDYDAITKILERLTYWNSPKKQSVIDYIVSNSFLFPDLSGDLTHNSWSFAHEMTSFVRKNNLADDFISFAGQICSENKKNQSLLDRFESLIKQYLNPDFVIQDII